MFSPTETRRTARAVLALGLLLVPSAAAAQGTKINREMPRGSYSGGGDVNRFQLSPDQSWVVYVADEVDERLELFSVPVDGSGPARKLNGAFTSTTGFGPNFTTFAITPTSDRVLYVADQATDESFELWCGPIDGSAPAVRISQALPPGCQAKAPLPAPGGQRVVYEADPTTLGVFELWSAPVDGSQPPVQLDGPGGGSIEEFAVSPDGVWVVYRDDQASAGVEELWRAPVDGSSGAVQLGPPLASFADVQYDFRISPDSSRVVYRVDATTDGAVELWSVPLDLSALPESLSGSLPSGREVLPFEVASDSSGVAYRVDSAVNAHYQLYWSALDGAGAPLLLSGALVSGGSVGTIALSPDGQVAAFEADAEVDGIEQLYSVPVDLSRPRLRLTESPTGWIVSYFDFVFTPDGSRLVFTANQTGATSYDLWSVPVEGSSPPLALSEPGQITEFGRFFKIAPGGAWVLYLPVTPHGPELWSVKPDRSAAPRVLQGARRLTSASYGFFEATNALAVFVADAETDELSELWRRPLDGSSPGQRLNSPLAPDAIVGDVSQYLWTPDSTRAVYRADQERDGLNNLYLAHTDGRPDPHALSAPHPSMIGVSPDGRWLAWNAGYYVVTAPLDGSQPPIEHETYGDPTQGSPVISPDSRHVAIVARQPGLYAPPIYTLYSGPIDAPGPIVPLNLDFFANELLVPRYLFTPDGRRVVFLEIADGVPRLRSAPPDGSGPAVTLHDPLVAGREIDLGFQVSPDGNQVVFVSDLEVAGQFQLYSVALTRPVARRPGSPLATRLNAPLGPLQDVDPAFRIGPDGKSVVYVADQSMPGVFELYSVPIRGGAAPVKISGPMVSGGSVGLGVSRSPYLPRLPQFEIGRIGPLVVYRADQDQDEVFELYSVRLDGSTPPVRLHPALASTRDVELLSVRVDPTGTKVVYAADARQDDVLELFSVPIDATAPPTVISGTFVTGGDVWTRPGLGAWQALEISPRGGHVVYLADQDADEVVELYEAPLDGQNPARKLNRTPVANGDVKSPLSYFYLEDLPPFRLSPDGRAVLYTADQDADEVMELYLSWLDRGVRQDGNPP